MDDKENKLPEDLEGTKDDVQENPELTGNAEDSAQQDENASDTQDIAKEPEPREVGQEELHEPELTDATGDEPSEPSEEGAEKSEERLATPVVEESATSEDSSVDSISKTKDAESEEAHEESDDEEDEEDEDKKLLESLHFDNPTKEELLTALKKVSHMKNMRILDKALKEIKPPFEHICEQERTDALKAFVEEGNDEGDFAFKGEEIDSQFFELAENLRFKKQKFFSDLEKEKDENLKKKNDLLEQLRELVDGEESTASINTLKQLQNEWRKIGQVPGAHVKSMWANYNAIIDRFYDNRSIYFELKELDRKKNLEHKLEICQKAEDLESVENIKDAIIQLNELHEEFKHLGPIPKEDQELVWQRFKSASDKIYAKRKDYFDHLKTELNANAEKKQQLGDQAAEFASFNSDRISDWNKKTKELVELQRKWEAIGGLPREKAKHINKHFWSNFKEFFGNKSAFFKALEGQREENLKKKEALLEKALQLQQSEEWDKTANELKNLQNQWREIGPVPEKFRNEVYAKFKAACDQFFENKRAKGNAQNKEFEVNLKKKEEICNELESFLSKETIELEQVYDLLDAYSEIGFVPRHAIKSSHNRFDEVTNQLLDLEDLSDSQHAELQTQIQLSKLKNSPHGSQKINRKEGAIKRKISSLESDVATFKTNMDFFAASKNADKLKAEIEEKIKKAQVEIKELRKQLKLLKQI